VTVADGVLLVGGGGFMGRALAQRFVSAGRRVHVVSRRPDPQLPGVGWCAASAGDVDRIAPLLDQCGTVFYLASTTTPGSSMRNPELEGEDNLVPFLRFLGALQGRRDVHLVFVGSGGTAYGNPERLPVDESAPTQPFSFHAAAKLAAESFLAAHAHQGHPVTILRASNLYGPEQALRSGFGLIRTVLEHVKRGTTMEVWGDGLAVRDFLFIDDAVTLCSAVADDPSTGIFNMGTGRGYTIREVCELSEAISGRPLEVNLRPGRAAEVAAIVLDSTRAAQRYGWRPAVGLREGMERTWQWMGRLA
jgi:UDP-glucose 4-epimerase